MILSSSSNSSRWLTKMPTSRQVPLTFPIHVTHSRSHQCLRPNKQTTYQAHHLPFVFNTINRVLQNARLAAGLYTDRSANAAYLDVLFDQHEEGVQAFLQQSSLFDRMKRNTFQTASRAPRERHQMSAKLHCLYGSPIMQAGRTRSARTYPYACSKVYDLRQYTPRTKWGPFMDDDTGRVDWEKLEAITIVIAKNVVFRWPNAEVFEFIFGTNFYGSYPNSFAYQEGCEKQLDFGDKELDEKDPYGVTGYWYRVRSTPGHSPAGEDGKTNSTDTRDFTDCMFPRLQ